MLVKDCAPVQERKIHSPANRDGQTATERLKLRDLIVNIMLSCAQISILSLVHPWKCMINCQFGWIPLEVSTLKGADYCCHTHHVWRHWHIFWISKLYNIKSPSILKRYEVLCTSWQHVSSNASHRRLSRVHHCRPHSHHRCRISTGRGCSGRSCK